MTAPDFRGDPPSHYLCSLLEEAGLPHLFTTRHFPGVSAFREPGPPLGPGAQELLAAHALAAQRSSIHLPFPRLLTHDPQRRGKAASRRAMTGLSTS